VNALVLRITRTVALVAFVTGGATAAWNTWHGDSILEFQAGHATTGLERFQAVIQSAAIEGLGFGLLALVLATLAHLVTRRGASDERDERACATFALLAGACGGWLSLTWFAEDALPFLTGHWILWLDVAGFLVVLAALWLFRLVAGWMPGSPADSRGALAARTLACLAVVLPIELFAQELLRADHSTQRIVLVGGLFLLALPLAALLARPLQRLAGLTGLPRRLDRALGALFLACALGSLPSVNLSRMPTEAEYERVARTGANPAGPNVVLVTIDTLRADHLGSYGYERDTSPFLDSLAAAGTRFADPVAAASWTKPATGTILTGLYPSRHGALYHGSTLQLPDGEQTLAEAFHDQGYVTAGFVSNPNIKAVFDFDRGFDAYFDSPVEDTLTRACIRGTLFGQALMKLTRHQFNWKYENDVRQMNSHIGAWLAANHERPFFLYLHYIDPHIPYSPPREYREQFAGDHGFVTFNERKRLVGTDLYDGEIRYTDEGLRELVAKMKELENWENTIFVVTSDHGEEFFEHGVLGHGFSLYQPVLRVPLIFHGPGIPAGQVVEQPVQILDLAATLLDTADAGIRQFGDGQSFAGSLRDPDWLPSSEYFLENEFGQDDANQREFVFSGIRSGRWKLVLTERNAFFPPRHSAHGREALFDLENDPEERENLIANEEHRDLIAGLLERLESHSEFLFTTGFRDVKPAALDPDIEASLAALGY